MLIPNVRSRVLMGGKAVITHGESVGTDRVQNINNKFLRK